MLIDKKYSFFKTIHLIDFLLILSLIIFGCIYTFFTKALVQINGDAGNGYWAVIAGNAKIFMNGEYPLWNPYLWGGYTNSGSIFGCFYPIFIPLYYIFWNSRTQTLSFLFLSAVSFIHLSIFSLGTYLLEKKITNNRLISWACASLATFCGCTLQGHGWSYIFIGFSWIPVFLLTYSNALDSSKRSNLWIALSAFIIGLIGLGSTSHGLLFTLVCMLFIFISYVSLNHKSFFKYFKTSLFVGLLGIFMCAIQLIPFLQNMALANRSVDSASGVLDYTEYMRNTVPASDMHQLLGQHTGWYAMSLLLFLAAIYAYKLKTESTKPLMRFGKVLLIFTICMVSGAFLPDLMWYIPGIKQMREQFLWVPYLSFACSILAGYTLSGFYNHKIRLKEYKVHIVDVIVLILMIISLLPENNSNLVEFSIKIMLLGIIAISSFLQLNEVTRKRVLCVGLCLYVSFDFMALRIKTEAVSLMTALEANKRVEEVVNTTQREFGSLNMSKGERILTWSPEATYPSNIAATLGYYDCFAYINPIYEKNWYIHSMDLHTRAILQNIRYFMVSENNNMDYLKWFNDVMGKQPEQKINLYSGFDATKKSGVYVYKNDAEGNAWLVSDYEIYEDDGSENKREGIFNRLNEIDLSSTCLINKTTLDESFSADKEVKGKVVLNKYNANKVDYQCYTDSNSILVTTDILYPGWKVYVDGVRQNILEVNYAFRGVYLTQGEHHVEFVYMPNLVIVGGCISTLAIFVGVGMLVIDFRNKRKAK